MSVVPFQSVLHDAKSRRDALDIHRSFIVEAPAGSGKTALLIQRYLRLLAAVDQPEAVLALTFTNKAAAEMRHRVLQALEAAQQPVADNATELEQETWRSASAVRRRDVERGWNLNAQPHRLNLRTIDSLCAEIARTSPVLSGGVGQATPVQIAMPLYRAAARAVLLQLGGADAELNDALQTVLLHRDADLRDCEALLGQMLATREQWATLIPLGRDLLDEANLDATVRPRLDSALEDVLCAALGNLQTRFSPGLLQQVATLAHMLAQVEGYNGEPNPVLACGSLPHAPGATADDLHHWEMLAHLLVKSSGGWRKTFNKNLMRLQLDKLQKAELTDAIAALSHDDTLMSLLCSLKDLPPRRYPDDQWRVVKALFRLLYHALIELKILFATQQVCDFTELSLAARSALRHGDADRMGMQLEHLLVDEMQDTSSAQYELLEMLTAGWNGLDQTVFLVGDPKQSIYLFRQAKVERFMASMQSCRLGNIPLQPLKLTSNFRSGAGLVREFNRAFAQMFQGADNIQYTPARAALAVTPHDLLDWHATPQRHYSDAPSKATEVRRAYREEAETIAAIAHRLRLPASQVPAARQRSTAVLVRSRVHAAQVMQKLGEAGVPFRAVEIETLAERPEVLDVVAIARALLHPADRTAWLAVLRAPWCGLTLGDLHTVAAGDDSTQRKQALRLHLRQRALGLDLSARTRLMRTLDVMDHAIAHRGRAPLSVAVHDTWRALQAESCVTAREHGNVRAFFKLLERMEAAGESPDPETLNDRLKLLYADADTASDAVEVLTIHKAKGLEWDVVFVPGLHRGSRYNGAGLLDWAELPQLDSEGRPQVLLAPIQRRGEEPGRLNRYLKTLRKSATEAELQRLFYVAATRARTALHLFASPSTNADGMLSNPANTLLKAAWPSAQAYFAKPSPTLLLPFSATPLPVPGLALAASGDSDDLRERDGVQPSSPLRRLPLEAIQVPALLARPQVVVTPEILRFHQRPSGSLAARLLGTTVHALLQHVAELNSALQPVPPHVSQWSQRIRTLVRTGGMSPQETVRVCHEAEQALAKTLADPAGQWLLEPHSGAVNEGELFDTSKHHIERYRFDRSFFAGTAPQQPGHEILWIVDYKTSTRRDADRPGTARDEFLRAERLQYGPSLNTYARLAKLALPEETTVMLALYHPLLPHLDYWPYAPAANG